LSGLSQPLAGFLCRSVMQNRPLGLGIVILGVAVIAIGFLVWSGALSWFGRLPGDIRIDRGNVKVFFPITSMILISIVLTLVLNLLRRFF
jgi:uncharacterized membrane protein